MRSENRKHGLAQTYLAAFADSKRLFIYLYIIMKKKLLKSLLLFSALVVGNSNVWAEDYSHTYNYSDLRSMISGNYADDSSYWRIPETAGNDKI